MRLLTGGILSFAVTVTALAQDPPSRVARLNWINGPVSFQPAGLDTWGAATVNYPLTTGDHVYTDERARAEVHIGPNAIRLNSQTDFGFLNLDDATVQMRFTQGAMELRLRALADQDLYEVDTPNGAISLLRTGDYRIDTDPDRNATMITVNSGEAEVTANGNSFAVHPRQTAYVAGNAAPDIRGINPPDDFDSFYSDRDMREQRRPPPQHVPVSMVGYEDLDNYGAWREMPDYGWVWAPPVQAGWTPYHDGRWAWVEPWGWTWVDEAPWGFAPFHYGRWANSRGAWFWVPGDVRARPVYAPALVAFVGGPGFRVSAGFGGGIGAVAWFPLGPQEVYRPAYAVSPAYVRNVNIRNVANVNVTNINVTNVNVTNIRYVNQNVQGAVTAVPQTAFVSARSIRGEAARVTPEQMAGAQVQAMAQVAPQRTSLIGPAGRSFAHPADAVMGRQVFVKATPPPPPVAFQARQSALAQNGGRPLAAAQIEQIRQQQPSAVMNRASVRAAGFPAAPQGRAVFAPGPAAQPARPAFPNAPVNNAPVNNTPQNRLDVRPPNVNRPAPEARPAPEFRQQPAPPVQPVPQAAPPSAPVPQPRPAPEFRRAPEVRPAPQGQPAAPAAAAPAPPPQRAARPPQPNRPAPDERKKREEEHK